MIGPRVDSGAVEHNPAAGFVLPADGSHEAGIGLLQAVWSIESDADAFEIFFGTTPGALELIGTTDIGLFELPLFAPETTYYWRIDALRAGIRTIGTERAVTTRAALIVTTLADENDGTPDPATGTGTSLREALRAASIAGGGDRIEFAASLDGGNMVLGGSALTVVGNVQIDASSLDNGLTVSGGQLSRVLETSNEGTQASRVELDRLTITGAKNGALSSSGHLVMRDCVVTRNTGNPSIIIASKLEIDRTQIILNRTDSTSAGSIFTTNFVARDSTIAANTNSTSAFAVAVQNSGELTNVTIADNIGLGLVKNGTGALHMRQVTIAGNRATFTGGLRINSGAVHLENCIVAGNLTASTASDPDMHGSIASGQGFNFVGGEPGLAPLGDYGGPTLTRPPFIGSPLIDPVEGMAESDIAIDQRGFPRISGPTIDAGAVEFGTGPRAAPADGATNVASYLTTLYWTDNPGADSFEVFIGTQAGTLSSVGTTAGGWWRLSVLEPETTYFWRIDSTTGGAVTAGEIRSFTTRPALLVTTAIDENDGTADPAVGAGTSLREAIAASADTIDADAIRFAPALDGATIVLGGTPVALANGVLLDALTLQSGLSLSAKRLSGTLYLPKFAEARIQGLTVRDGARVGTTSGYGIHNEGKLNVARCIVTGNRDSGIYSTGQLTVEDCLIHRNRGTFSAGGIASYGETTLRRTTIADNWASSHGGIRHNDAPLLLEQCTVTGNRSDNSISAISSNSGDVTLRQCTIAGNRKGSSSSITVGVSFATLTIENSIIVAPNFQDTISASNRVQLGVNLTTGNPMLAPLGYYGGPTPTMPPVAGSPAINPAGGSASGDYTTDQRGLARVVGSILDIGAVEFSDEVATFPVNETSGVPSYHLPLAWTPVSGATSYQIFLGTDSGELTLLGETTPGLWIADALTPGTSYLWRVDAVTDGGLIPGAVRSFTTRPAILVTTTADEDNVTRHGGTGLSLREAMFEAGESLGGDTIRFTPALEGATLPLGGTPLLVDSPVAIDGTDLVQGVAISGSMASTVLDVSALTNAMLVACTIRDAGFNPALGTSSGSGIRNFGELRILRCSLVDNRAKIGGGGVYNEGILDISHSTISGNRAGHYGGGIANEGLISLTHSTVSNNSSITQGSGLRDVFSTSAIAHSIIAGNHGTEDVYGTIESQPGANFIGENPYLAPLGAYGGPTPTMPPLPGSPVIDAASGSSVMADQRGYPVSGSFPDIGAVEFQGDTDLDTVFSQIWTLDLDGDGRPFGIEHALGTNPFAPDPHHPGHFGLPSLANGEASLTFGFNPEAAAYTVWILKRSADLSAGSFEEIYRYHGPTAAGTSGTDVSVTVSSAAFTVTDENPPPGKAFYLLETIFDPPRP